MLSGVDRVELFGEDVLKLEDGLVAKRRQLLAGRFHHGIVISDFIPIEEFDDVPKSGFIHQVRALTHE